MKTKITDKLTIHLSDNAVVQQLGHHFLTLLKQQNCYTTRPWVFLCIGSDCYTGDALGPLVGSYLEEHTDCIVYGSLDFPVHAGNLIEVVHKINQRYFYPLIIAVDACLGKKAEIGNLEMWQGALQAGIAVGNRLPCVGDISLVGVVNAGSHLGYVDLQNTPLSIVVKLSKAIGKALHEAFDTASLQHCRCRQTK